MNLLIAGASGLIGRELKKEALKRGHNVFTLGRSETNSENSFYWNPNDHIIQKECLKDIDVIINLAGDNIASGIWTKSKKESIKNSRIDSTKLIVQTLKSENHKVSALINASAIGYYNSSEIIQDEDSIAGNGFLSSVCLAWEAEAKEVEALGVRVALPRIGIVLTKQGAALQKMLLPFKLCLGGALGSGRQYWSWISLRDVVASLIFIAEHKNLNGPVNLCSPNPLTNYEFTKTLGKALGRPTFLHVPKLVLSLILGEMAEALLLSSLRITSRKLTDAGFKFQDTALLEFLNEELRTRR